MGTFVRAKYSPVTLGLIYRTLTVNLLTALAWETMRVLFEVYTSEVRSSSPFVFSCTAV